MCIDSTKKIVSMYNKNSSNSLSQKQVVNTNKVLNFKKYKTYKPNKTL